MYSKYKIHVFLTTTHGGLQILMNPLYIPGSRIVSPYFDTRVRALARKYL